MEAVVPWYRFCPELFPYAPFETVQKLAIDKIVCHAPHATESKASTLFGSQR